MRPTTPSMFVLALALAVAACSSPTSRAPAKSAPGSSPGSGAAAVPALATSPKATTGADLTGSVTVPLSLTAGHGGEIIAQGGGNIVAQGGGNIVAQGGGNIVAQGGGNIVAQGGGNFRLASTGAPAVPLARTWVFLTGADGKHLMRPDGTPYKALTDAHGTYHFRGLPVGVTFRVQVEAATTTKGKVAKLAALVKTAEAGAIADVTPASTLVTVKLLAGKQKLGDLDVTNFHKAVETTKQALNDGDEPLDLSDEAKLLDKMKQVTAAKPELASTLDGVGQQLDVNAQDNDALEHSMSQVSPAPELDDANALCRPAPAASVLDDGSTGKPRSFLDASGVAVAADGTLYVVDAIAHQVWKVAPGAVPVAVGSPSDATDPWPAPAAIAVADGTLFVADPGHHAVHRLSAAGTPALLFGPDVKPALGDGLSTNPAALATRGNDELYVADADAAKLYRVKLGTDAPAVTAIATEGKILTPGAIAVDDQGTLYVADTYNHAIWQLPPQGEPTLLAGAADGTPGEPAAASEPAAQARFDRPVGIAVTHDGTKVYVADAGNQAIRVIATGASPTVTTLAALQCDAQAPERLASLGGLALSPDGNTLVAANGRHVVSFSLAAPSPAASSTASPSAQPSVAPSAPASPAGSATPTASASPTGSPTPSTSASASPRP